MLIGSLHCQKDIKIVFKSLLAHRANSLVIIVLVFFVCFICLFYFLGG